MDLMLVAVALVAGLDRLRLALLALCLFAPWVFAALVVALSRFLSRGTDDRSVRFLEGMAAELRSGSSLRQAVAAAAGAVGQHSLAVQAFAVQAEELGREAATSFPEVGGELAVSLGALDRSGAPSADLFDELAAVAFATGEIRREVRIASAPGRAAAGLLLGAPVAYLGVRWSTGDLSALFASPSQRSAGVVGVALFAAGLAGSLWMLRRAS